VAEEAVLKQRVFEFKVVLTLRCLAYVENVVNAPNSKSFVLSDDLLSVIVTLSLNWRLLLILESGVDQVLHMDSH